MFSHNLHDISNAPIFFKRSYFYTPSGSTPEHRHRTNCNQHKLSPFLQRSLINSGLFLFFAWGHHISRTSSMAWTWQNQSIYAEHNNQADNIMLFVISHIHHKTCVAQRNLPSPPLYKFKRNSKGLFHRFTQEPIFERKVYYLGKFHAVPKQPFFFREHHV